jgi:hypothetical protein
VGVAGGSGIMRGMNRIPEFNPAPDPQKTIEAEHTAGDSLREAQQQAEAKRELSGEARDATRASGKLFGHN